MIWQGNLLICTKADNMKIIFNADDFGYSKGANLGVIEAYQKGLVRSTTIMAGMSGFDHAVKLLKENLGLGIGVHLTLTTGKSVGGTYSTITDDVGGFLPLIEIERRAHAGELDMAEIEAEYEAQIEKVMDEGIQPDHFDSHHHTHNLPGIVEVFLRLAKKYDVGVRINDKNLLVGEFADIKTTDVFEEGFHGDGATAENLKDIIAGCNGSLEIMCHPAYVDNVLLTYSSYNIVRCTELSILTSYEMMEFVHEGGYELCSFSEI